MGSADVERLMRANGSPEARPQPESKRGARTADAGTSDETAGPVSVGAARPAERRTASGDDRAAMERQQAAVLERVQAEMAVERAEKRRGESAAARPSRDGETTTDGTRPHGNVAEAKPVGSTDGPRRRGTENGARGSSDAVPARAAAGAQAARGAGGGPETH